MSLFITAIFSIASLSPLPVGKFLVTALLSGLSVCLQILSDHLILSSIGYRA